MGFSDITAKLVRHVRDNLSSEINVEVVKLLRTMIEMEEEDSEERSAMQVGVKCIR